MTDRSLSLSKEARGERPYRSLYAALLLQSFQDALDAALSGDGLDTRNEAEAVLHSPHTAPTNSRSAAART